MLVSFVVVLHDPTSKFTGGTVLQCNLVFVAFNRVYKIYIRAFKVNGDV